MLPSPLLRAVTIITWSPNLHSAVAWYADPLGSMAMVFIRQLPSLKPPNKCHVLENIGILQ